MSVGVFRRWTAIRVGDQLVTIVDDYGHHPTEVAAVIATARAVWPERRLVMCYQPHRFSRTRDLFDDFLRVLSELDVLVVLATYSAGEDRIAGADSRALCQGLRDRGLVTPLYAQDVEEAAVLLATHCAAEDVVLVQGAGNVSALSQKLIAEGSGAGHA